MTSRTRAYIKRKKAYKGVIHFTDLKSLLRAEFHSTSNFLVKQHILKAYESLNKGRIKE